MKLWLDDLRPAPEGWKWVKDSLECIGWLQLESVEVLSLDHDLGLNKLDGYYVLEWIEYELAVRGKHHKMLRIPELLIHSANPVGRKNMEMAIESINRLKETERTNE